MAYSRPDSFLNLNTPFRNTICYKKARCLSAITDVFVKKYICCYSRTTDQMVQASRSVKQNLIEGAVDGATSKETEIKLFNVARGSLHELLEDFTDFLLFNNLPRWDLTDSRVTRTRDRIKTEIIPNGMLNYRIIARLIPARISLLPLSTKSMH